MSGKACLGTSGFTYDHLKGVCARLNNGARVHAVRNVCELIRLAQTAPSAKRPDESKSSSISSGRRPRGLHRSQDQRQDNQEYAGGDQELQALLHG